MPAKHLKSLAKGLSLRVQFWEGGKADFPRGGLPCVDARCGEVVDKYMYMFAGTRSQSRLEAFEPNADD